MLDKDTIIKPLIKSTILTSILAVSSLLLTSCGFHLRGYGSPMTYAVGSTTLIMDDDPTTFPLKQPLRERLNSVGINVVNGREDTADSQGFNAVIRIDNVRFQKYELVGVLTEIRLVLSADVTYQTLQNNMLRKDGETAPANRPITVKDTVQVERSYQFNEASVSVEDQQGAQIRDWLYEHLARRITDQYVALSLPRVSADSL